MTHTEIETQDFVRIDENIDVFENDLVERTFLFSIPVLPLLKHLPDTKKAEVVRYQPAKPPTSAGANYEEAQVAGSKGGFYNKLKISYRELRKTRYGLKLIHEMKWMKGLSIDKAITESYELLKFFFKPSSLKLETSFPSSERIIKCQNQ